MPEVSISDAEWQVMNVVWEGEPITSQKIIGQLEDRCAWAPATVRTMLHRLVKKQVLAYEAEGNRYVYRAQAKRKDCIKHASSSFLERVFSGARGQLLAHFIGGSKLTPTEIAQLRQLLDQQEKKR